MKMRLRIAIWGTILSVCSTLACGASLNGPETVAAGRIAVFTAEVEGDALIFPAEHVDLLKDSDKKTFYTATNVPGKYTLIFFAVEDGKPALSQKVFEVKALPSPSPEPSPAPQPGPEPEPDTDLTETEKEGLIWALQSVCYHIEKKNLSSPAGIRASFKTAVMQKILTETKAVSKTLDDWSTRTDWSSSASIKKSFEAFLVEMGRPWKGADETFASIDLTGLGLESESPAPKVKTTCPTGTCPPVRYYY